MMMSRPYAAVFTDRAGDSRQLRSETENAHEKRGMKMGRTAGRRDALATALQ